MDEGDFEGEDEGELEGDEGDEEVEIDEGDEGDEGEDEGDEGEEGSDEAVLATGIPSGGIPLDPEISRLLFGRVLTAGPVPSTPLSPQSSSQFASPSTPISSQSQFASPPTPISSQSQFTPSTPFSSQSQFTPSTPTSQQSQFAPLRSQFAPSTPLQFTSPAPLQFVPSTPFSPQQPQQQQFFGTFQQPQQQQSFTTFQQPQRSQFAPAPTFQQQQQPQQVVSTLGTPESVPTIAMRPVPQDRVEDKETEIRRSVEQALRQRPDVIKEPALYSRIVADKVTKGVDYPPKFEAATDTYLQEARL